MRRFIAFLTLALLFIITLTASAQTASTPTPVPTVASPQAGQDFSVLATQVYDNAQKASDSAALAQQYAEIASQEAGGAIDHATNLLGLFESVGAVVGIFIPLLAGVAAFVGITRLNSAQRELEEARAGFEREMREKQAELEVVREELERSAEKQRENAANANLSLSLLTLGERQYRSQDFEGALNTYRRALELDPNSLITHYRLGYVYTQSGKLEQAQHHLTRALETENNFAPALAALGYVYRRIGEKMPEGIERERTLNKAESLLLEGLSISPKLVDEDDESWWGSLGGLYRRRNQLDEAIRAYEKAGEVTPKSSYAFSNLALLYMTKKDRELMMKTYQRVEQLAWGEVQADVDNYWAYADLLTARLALGKIKEAEEVFTSVLEIAPADSPYVFESLIDTLQRLRAALGEESGTLIEPFIDGIKAYAASRDGEKTTQSP